MQWSRAARLQLSWLLACGMIAPIGFLSALLLEGWTHPGYDPVHDYVSLLSLGPDGWTQTANFLVCGTLMFPFAAGVQRVVLRPRQALAGALLFRGVGLGLLVAGLFVTDPMGSAMTIHGTIHFLATVLVGICMSAACFVLGFGLAQPPRPRWRLYSRVTGVLLVVLFVASNLVQWVQPFSAVQGTVQRVVLFVGCMWIVILAIRLRATLRPAPAEATIPAKRSWLLRPWSETSPR
jgi:hypothetical membrane protein